MSTNDSVDLPTFIEILRGIAIERVLLRQEDITASVPFDQQFELFLRNIATAASSFSPDVQRTIDEELHNCRHLFRTMHYSHLLDSIFLLLDHYNFQTHDCTASPPPSRCGPTEPRTESNSTPLQTFKLQMGEQLSSLLREVECLAHQAGKWQEPEAECAPSLKEVHEHHAASLRHLSNRIAAILSSHLDSNGSRAPAPGSLRDLLEDVSARRLDHDATIPPSPPHLLAQQAAEVAQTHAHDLLRRLSYAPELLEPLDPPEQDTAPISALQSRVQSLEGAIQIEPLRNVLQRFRERLGTIPPLVEGTSVPLRDFSRELEAHCYGVAHSGSSVRSFCSVEALKRRVEKFTVTLDAANERYDNRAAYTGSMDDAWRRVQEAHQNLCDLREGIDTELDRMADEAPTANLAEGRLAALQTLRVQRQQTDVELERIDQNIADLTEHRRAFSVSLQQSRDAYARNAEAYQAFLEAGEKAMTELEGQALEAIRGLERALGERVVQRALMVSRERELRVLETASMGVFDALSRREELLVATRRREEARGRAQDATLCIVDHTLSETKACVDGWAAQTERHRLENRRAWCELADRFVGRINYRYSQRLESLRLAEERAEEIDRQLMEGSILGDEVISGNARERAAAVQARMVTLREEIRALESARAAVIQTLGEKTGCCELDGFLHYVPPPILASHHIAAPEATSLPSVAPLGESFLHPTETMCSDCLLSSGVFPPTHHAAPQIRAAPLGDLIVCEGWAASEPPFPDSKLLLQEGRYQAHFAADTMGWEASSAKTDQLRVAASVQSPEPVHIRRIRLDALGDRRAHQEALLRVLCNAPRAHCHNTREWFVEGEHLYVVLRYLGCVLGLDEWIAYWATLAEHDETFHLPFTFIASVAKQLLRALCELHTAGVAHGGVAPQTVHLRGLDAVFLDLHITGLLDSHAIPAEPAEPDRAPEENAIHDQVADPRARRAQLAELDRHKGDIYRLGLIVMKMAAPMAACEPFPSLLAKFQQAAARFPPELSELVGEMLEQNPSLRPTCNELLSHALFRRWAGDLAQTNTYCPLTREVITDPIEHSGATFQRASFLRHVRIFGVHPFTGEPLAEEDLRLSRLAVNTSRSMTASTRWGL